MQPPFVKDTFLWYDLETYGLNPRYDRIAQFAACRTDMDLNPIGDPIVLYGKISDDYLPDPLSCMVTGIAPGDHPEALCEYDLAVRINQEFSQPYTVVVGFNNLKFDDEMVRSLLYRNLMDPYEREWKNHCSRWDIIDLVRAAHDFRPENIQWPPAEMGANGQLHPVFKLTELTKANHIDQTGAHDAMVDVYATIAIARLIKEKQPKLFEYAFRNRRKEVVKNLVTTPFGSPVLYTAGQFTNPNGCTALVVPITPVLDQNKSIYCFDLSKDPAPLLAATGEQLAKVPGLCKLAFNRCPFLTKFTSAFPDKKTLSRLGIDTELAQQRYRILQSDPSLILKLRELAANDEYEPVNDTDFQIYSGGFFPDADKQQFEVLHHTKPEEMLSLNIKFADPRAPEMVFRHVCRNWPEALTDTQKLRWKSFCANRLLNPPGGVAIDWNFFNRKIDERLESTETEARQKVVLKKLKDYGKQLYDNVLV
ncbi:MAG: exodeoxyribonuclease I [Sphaerochaeta sp.]|jgi:exodeoxyribonuclease-1|nr:exodeoxyribonuclease I [Sphaerochaeta sp.]